MAAESGIDHFEKAGDFFKFAWNEVRLLGFQLDRGSLVEIGQVFPREFRQSHMLVPGEVDRGFELILFESVSVFAKGDNHNRAERVLAVVPGAVVRATVAGSGQGCAAVGSASSPPPRTVS